MPRGTILIVDYEPAIIEFIAEALADEGYRTQSATSAEQAINMIIAEPPNAALIELTLGKRNGLDILRAVRTQGQAVPIIIMTATTISAQVLEEQGAAACLHKPFDLNDMLDCIAHCLQP